MDNHFDVIMDLVCKHFVVGGMEGGYQEYMAHQVKQSSHKCTETEVASMESAWICSTLFTVLCLHVMPVSYVCVCVGTPNSGGG